VPEKNILKGVGYLFKLRLPGSDSFRSDIVRVVAGSCEDLPQRHLLSLPYLTIASSGPRANDRRRS
jgi:hypothetical protein